MSSHARISRRALSATLAVGGLLFLPVALRAGQPEGPQDRLRVAEVDPEWFKIAERFPPPSGEHERDLAHEFSGRILRWGNLLALKLDNGKFAWLVNMLGPPGFGCCEVYHLEDFWPDQGLYVVDVLFDEYSRTWLISDRTAEVTELVGTPHRDPSAPGIIVSVLASDSSGYRAEVWERAAQGWKRVYHCDQLAYTTDFIRWEGPGKALLGGPDRGGHLHESILAEVEGRWRTDACEDK